MVEVNLMRIKIKEKSVILSYLLIGLGLFYIGGAALNAAIPAIEREALIALYNATGGDHWKRNTGWKGNNNEIDGFSQIGSEGTWYGITIMADHIISIDLRGNNLTGSIPKELGNPGHLVELFLNNNDLSGVPPELGNLSNLKKLYLGRNNLSSIPDIGNLTNLQVLQLGYNPLTTIPTGIGNLINLEHFYIAGVESLTSLPPEIGKLKNLTGFYLYKCSIHSLPAEIGDLSRLERFYISHNKLSSLPAEMGQLHNLESLDLSHNNLTSLPPELGNLKRIDRFFLNHNRITGIPPELGNLSTLWGLELEFNRLTWLPPELGNLDNLNSIKLGDNYLAAIPEAVFGMESLVYLNLGNNRIEGPIPDEIGDLRNLEELNLGSNNLTGPVPVSILKLTNLECGLFGRPWEFNRLFSNNERVKAFLARMGIYWENTQTVPPTQVSASPVFSTSVKVSWQPIKFIWKTGGYQVYYSTGPSGPWTYAGMTASKSEAFLYIHGLTPGQTFYFRVRTKTDAHNENSNPLVSHPGKVVSAVIPQTVPAPFGSMDTPANDSVVSSSIPVSGWAISNTGVENVKIYSEQDEGLVYMGDSVFVEGARPDIESLFPGFPNNHKAGWGYMLLTNLLPNNGNGTFVIHAIAMDVNGETSTLGTKTIHCDNANAVKPFGAIDTPTQGGAASGSGFVNFGWALTPQPNTIPTDGSTITVWVNGVPLGNPVYNRYRSDIATLFPNYNNSNGAIGYFYLDTTAYDNGVHTIQWTVKDDAGNSDGIGSRYFTVNNNQNRAQSQTQSMRNMDIRIHDIPLDMSSLRVKTGYNPGNPDEEKRYGHNEPAYIEIRELGRVELHLTDETGEGEIDPGTSFVGYQLAHNGLRLLPVGSYLDRKRGLFYWLAGVAFVGNYHLVFIKTDSFGNQTRKEVIVTIKPKQ